MSKSKASR